MSDIGLILLAAGGSSRMGRPKQLIEWRGVSLLRRAVDTALGSGCDPVVVVLGAAEELAARELAGCGGVLIELNPDWARGMGASIKYGLRRLLRERPGVDAAVVTLCDQPRVEASHLRELCEAYRRTGKGVVASSYQATVGPPCVFASRWFPRLLELDDASGAKRLIGAAGDDRCDVPLDAAGEDVDTPEDFRRLERSE